MGEKHLKIWGAHGIGRSFKRVTRMVTGRRAFRGAGWNILICGCPGELPVLGVRESLLLGVIAFRRAVASSLYAAPFSPGKSRQLVFLVTLMHRTLDRVSG